MYKTFKEKCNKEPQSQDEYEEVKLGLWCRTQRKTYKKGKLDDTKIKLLNKVGFIWDPLEFDWQINFELYKTFKEKCNKEPQRQEEYEGIMLGSWVNTQRAAYKKGKLDVTKVNLLNQAGFGCFCLVIM